MDARHSSYWGPSLLMLASSLSLGACRVPSATIDAGSAAPPGDEGQRAPAQAQPKASAPMPKVRGFGIVDAELSGDGQQLQLSFSRPLAPTEDIDPNDFRLSIGYAYTYRQYAYAYYYDVVYYVGDYDGVASFETARAEQHSLLLTLNHPLPLSYCSAVEAEVRALQSEPGIKARGGVFLHYAPSGAPVRDAKGHKLGSFAEQWVLSLREAEDPYDAVEVELEGGKARRAFSGAIPVRCGPVLPPGPR